MPIDILVHFEDGTEKVETWDGKDRSFELNYEGTNKVEWAHIDPEEKVYMDKNFIKRNPCFFVNLQITFFVPKCSHKRIDLIWKQVAQDFY